MAQKVDFKTLYTKALSEWPSELDLARLGDKGLNQLSDYISDPYIDSDEEVLICGMHDAIHIALLQLVRSTPTIKTAELKSETVKALFEDRISTIGVDPESLGWRAVDFELVRQYHAQTKAIG